MSRFLFAALAVALASSASASEVLQLRQGTAAQVQAYVPALGEPVYDTTDNRLYLGDGATAGGNGVVMQHDLASAVTSSLLSGSLTGLLVGNGASAATAITPGAGVAAGLAAAINGSGGFVGYSGALGTPASGVLTHATGLPVATGISGLGSGVAAALAQPLSTSGGIGPVVSNNTQLSALPSTYAASVTRLGYAAPGDAPPLLYISSGSACSLNAGLGDGGLQVPTNNGGCWNATQPSGGWDARIWGAKCDGTTDDTAIFTAAGVALNSLGGGMILYPPKSCYSATGFTLPANVQIGGPLTEEGQVATNNYVNQPYTLILPSSATITMSTHTGIHGINIARFGMSAPNTLRGYLTEIGKYAGTAITCNGATSITDVDIDHVFVIGFQYAVNSNCTRTTITHIKGDNTAGILISNCYDLCVLEDVKIGWPYISSVPAVPQLQLTSISGAANNGSGLIRITLPSAPSTPIITGDTVWVGAVGGVPNSLGRWTATAISTTVFDLQGSTWAGTYTSGGTVLLDATFRSGAAYDFENVAGGPVIVNLEEFGHSTCIHYGGTTSDVMIHNGWCDSELPGAGEYDNLSVKLLNDGTASDNAFQGFVDGAGYIFKNNSTSSYGLFSILPGTIVGAVGWQSGIYPITLNSGTLDIDSASLETGGTPASTNLFYIGASPVQGIRITNSFIGGTVTYNNAGIGCPLYKHNGQVGPCGWTPVLIGASTAGSQTYTTQTGQYYQHDGLLTAQFEILLSALGGTTAGQLEITGLPAASLGTLSQSCSAPFFSGTSLSSGFNNIMGTLSGANVNFAKIGASGASGLLPSDISNTFHVFMTCVYDVAIPPQ